MIRPPPRSTRTDTLFPYTTLFRSHRSAAARIRRLPGSVIRQTPLLRGVPGSIYSRKDWCNARRGRHHRSALRKEQGRAQVRSTTSLPALLRIDRKSVVEGKSVSVRVDLGGRRIIKKKSRR